MKMYHEGGAVHMKRKEILTAVALAWVLAVLFVSAVFLSAVISYSGVLPAYACIILTAAVYGIAMISQSYKIALLKWGLSVPFSVPVLLYFWKTNYAVRALNWKYPDYGTSSAGGNFAGFSLLVFLAVSCLIAGIAGLCANEQKYEKRKKAQYIISFGAAAVTVAVVLLLQMQFPPYEAIRHG